MSDKYVKVISHNINQNDLSISAITASQFFKSI